MDLKPEHIASKRKVGTLNGFPVIAMATTGGLNMILCAKGGTVETLGVGPHPAVSKYLAEQREPGIEWTELSKSDSCEFASFEWILPKYQELTNKFRELETSNG